VLDTSLLLLAMRQNAQLSGMQPTQQLNAWGVLLSGVFNQIFGCAAIV